MTHNDWPTMSWDELFMRHVYLIASKSKDPRTKVGSVIIRNNAIISEGYNGICRGVKDDLEDRMVKPNKFLWFEHAERNSIFHCARNGISTEGTTLYTQGCPCSDCMRAIIQSGIKELVLHEEWEHGLMMDHPRENWNNSLNVSDIMAFESRLKIRIFAKKLDVKAMFDGKIFIV